VADPVIDAHVASMAGQPRSGGLTSGSATNARMQRPSGSEMVLCARLRHRLALPGRLSRSAGRR
jgi:hypothetical protein